MAVRQLRRLEAPAGPDLHDRMAAQALHAVYRRDEMARLEREHPELIVRRGEEVLGALPGGAARLVYSFTSDRAFTEHFARMFEELLPRVRRLLEAEAVRFRLTHAPSRPVVEPVLKSLWFAPVRDWWGFTLDRRPITRLPAVKGVRFHEGSADDVEAIARIDREAFPDTPMPPSVMRARIEGGDERVLIADERGEAAGFCTYAQTDAGEGHIGTLAVAEAARGRGIGEALLLRAAKRLFAGGARRITLTTDDDATAAIRLYVKLGFRQTSAGRDYSRPVDPKALQRLKREKRGVMIKFGGWR